MQLPEARVLEQVGLQYILDGMDPSTPYGAELVRRPALYGPKDRAALEMQWRNVQTAVAGLGAQPAAYDRLRQLMVPLRDIRGTLRRCETEALTEVELFEVKRFLLQLARIAPLLAQIGDAYEGIAVSEMPGALALLDPEGHGQSGFTLGAAPTDALSRIRQEKRAVEGKLRTLADGVEREALLAARRDLVAQEEAEALAERIRLSEALGPYLEGLAQNIRALGALDYLLERAKVARRYGATMPRVSSGGVAFTGMIHPQVSDTLAAAGRTFTAVTIECPAGATVITGANMGGKSVALRALALNVLLCQAGFFACASDASLPLFDAVYCIGEDGASAPAGLSSFGTEVLRIQQMLADVLSGAFCLVALDEPARGTNPREGAALVYALVDRLSALRAVAVIATHYDGTAARAQAHYQAAGLRALDGALGPGDRLAQIAAHMDYGLVRVDASAPAPREALTVCRLLGLDPGVTDAMEQALTRQDAQGAQPARK